MSPKNSRTKIPVAFPPLDCDESVTLALIERATAPVTAIIPGPPMSMWLPENDATARDIDQAVARGDAATLAEWLRAAQETREAAVEETARLAEELDQHPTSPEHDMYEDHEGAMGGLQRSLRKISYPITAGEIALQIRDHHQKCTTNTADVLALILGAMIDCESREQEQIEKLAVTADLLKDTGARLERTTHAIRDLEDAKNELESTHRVLADRVTDVKLGLQQLLEDVSILEDPATAKTVLTVLLAALGGTPARNS